MLALGTHEHRRKHADLSSVLIIQDPGHERRKRERKMKGMRRNKKERQKRGLLYQAVLPLCGSLE